MSRCLFLLILGATIGAAHADPSRFSGGGQLRPPDAVSANGRFALKADLKPAAVVSANGRFSFQAALGPDAKSLAAVCGGVDQLFRNGFEN
jgi:hypothetical protein